MPFPPGKNAKELGIDTTRRFVAVGRVESYSCFHKGDVLEYLQNRTDYDGADFKRIKESEVKSQMIFWSDLDYADEPQTSALFSVPHTLPPNPFTKSLTQRLMNIFKTEPEKSLREAGLIDGDDMPTDLGVKYWIAMQLQDKAAADEFKRKVADKILEKK